MLLVEFSHATIMLQVSHDEHLISGSVGELWAVTDGKVAPFPGEFQDYKKMLQSSTWCFSICLFDSLKSSTWWEKSIYMLVVPFFSWHFYCLKLKILNEFSRNETQKWQQNPGCFFNRGIFWEHKYMVIQSK